MYIWVFPSDGTEYAQTIIWTQTITYCNFGFDSKKQKNKLSFYFKSCILFVPTFVRMAVRITLRTVWLAVKDFLFLTFCIFFICCFWRFLLLAKFCILVIRLKGSSHPQYVHLDVPRWHGHWSRINNRRWTSLLSPYFLYCHSDHLHSRALATHRQRWNSLLFLERTPSTLTMDRRLPSSLYFSLKVF